MVNFDVVTHRIFHRPYRYIYGDESGDTGFVFERGSSRYFVISLLLLNDPEPLSERIDLLRQQLSIPAHAEFKFYKTSNANRRVFLKAVNTYPFVGRAIIIDKKQLTGSWKRMRGTRFYTASFTELLRWIPVNEISGARLILDEYGAPDVARSKLYRTMKRDLGPEFHPFTKISMKRSRGHNLIQCADMVAGAVTRAWSKDDSSFYDLIKDKVMVLEYPPKENPPN